MKLAHATLQYRLIDLFTKLIHQLENRCFEAHIDPCLRPDGWGNHS